MRGPPRAAISRTASAPCVPRGSCLFREGNFLPVLFSYFAFCPPYLGFFRYQGCLCINPGQLARGTGGGTYAELAVHPIPKATLEKKQDGE